ncbi:MAG: glycosyltransferase family 4 protein [Candidatus Atribacteria bacterium]|nr:glycosyltransferase family 4 protein [Candidatus Atribacteria bacterium]
MAGRMRIATIIWKDAIGGAERSLCDLAAALDQSSFDMRFYYLSGVPGYFAKQIESFGFKTEFLNWKNGFDLIGRVRLIKKLKEFNPHVVHDHIIPPLTRPFIKFFIQRPVLATEHGSALQRSFGIGEKWRKHIERFDFGSCDFIAANSLASAEALRSVFHLSESKIKVVHLGIDLDQFIPDTDRQSNVEPLTIGFIGRIINAYKGVDYLPLVAKHLIDRYSFKFKMLIAGDGKDRKKVEKLCKDLEVNSHFVFLGWLEDVKSFLRKIDLLLVPSRLESLGLSALEALAMNIPVVAFGVQGLREILTDCPSGTLINPGDTNGMAEAIHYLRNNYVHIGSKGRDFVAEHFSNHKMARGYEAIYTNLSNRSKQI